MAKGPQKKRQEDFGTEFEEKVLYINRCSKVVKGGRKFSFSALILVGDGQGHVGYGFANIFTIEMEGSTIPHEVEIQWDGARILLKPAPAGTGVVAGSKVRSVLELGGVKDVIAKNLGSNNPLNQVKATFKALLQLKNRELCFAERKGRETHA